MTKEKTLGQKLGEAMIRVAERSGERVYHRVIQFANDDVYSFLEKVKRFERESRKIDIRIGYFGYLSA